MALCVGRWFWWILLVLWSRLVQPIWMRMKEINQPVRIKTWKYYLQFRSAEVTTTTTNDREGNKPQFGSLRIFVVRTRVLPILRIIKSRRDLFGGKRNLGCFLLFHRDTFIKTGITTTSLRERPQQHPLLRYSRNRFIAEELHLHNGLSQVILAFHPSLRRSSLHQLRICPSGSSSAYGYAYTQ